MIKILIGIFIISLLLVGCLQQQKPVKPIKEEPPIIEPPKPVEKSPDVVPPSPPVPKPVDELLTDDLTKSVEDLDVIGDLNLSDALPLDDS